MRIGWGWRVALEWVRVHGMGVEGSTGVGEGWMGEKERDGKVMHG